MAVSGCTWATSGSTGRSSKRCGTTCSPTDHRGAARLGHVTHAHATADVPASKKRTLNIAAAVIGLALVTAMFVLWPSTRFGNVLGDLGFGSEFYDARVEA